MSVTATRGVATLAHIVAELGSPVARSVADIVAAHGLSRSSVFSVTRDLERAGFVVRRDDGTMAAGPKTKALAWAAHGLAPLVGPAEAVVHWLRANLEGEVRLVAGDTLLLRLAGPLKDLRDGDVVCATRPIHDDSGCERIRLSIALSGVVALRPHDVACLDCAAATLTHHLRASG